MSPTIFSLLTAVLISKVKQCLPQVESFLFVDDTLFFIPGTPAQVNATLQTLLGLLRSYGDVSGYRLIDKCGIVFQGPDTLPKGTVLYEVKVRTKVKCLGTWLGEASIMEQYQGPPAKLFVKAQFLASLPMRVEVKISALYLLAYPVLRHIAVLFFPTQQVIKKANMAMRVALGIRSWALSTLHWRLPAAQGGYSLGTAREYLLSCHSTAYTRVLKALQKGKEMDDLREFQLWVPKKTPKLRLDTVHHQCFFMVPTTTSVMARFNHIIGGVLGVCKVMPWKLFGKGVAVECTVVAFGLLSQTSEVSGTRKPVLHLLLPKISGKGRAAGGGLCVHHGAASSGPDLANNAIV